MKRFAALTLIITLGWTSPGHAQDDGNRVQWTPYDFSISLPEGWTSAQTAEYMILGAPDDVEAMSNGETPADVVMMVEIVEAPLLEDFDAYLLRENLPFFVEGEERQFGDLELLTAEIRPIGDRQGMVLLVAATYRVTASAPIDQWATVQPMIEAAVASIEAAPTQRAPADRLTMTIQWHDVRLRVPDNFFISSLQPEEDMILLSTFENRLMLSRTFEYQWLWVTLRNYSPIRHLFSLETLLLSNETFGLSVTQHANLGEITMSDAGGFEAASVDFDFPDGGEVGRMVALRSPDSLYLIIAIAGVEQWEASERDLFVAILATVERGD